MKKLINIIVALILCTAPTKNWAHSPDETHTSIHLDDHNLIVHLEVPWSIADAVKKAYPQIENDLSAKAFWAFTKNYISDHFEVSQNGKVIPNHGIYQLPGAHSHSAKIELRYPVKTMESLQIRNTLLFNLGGHPKNYHQLNLTGQAAESFITCPDVADFVIDAPETTTESYAFILVFAIVGMMIGLMPKYL